MDVVPTSMVASSTIAAPPASTGKQAPAVGFPALLAMLEHRDADSSSPAPAKNNSSGKTDGKLKARSAGQLAASEHKSSDDKNQSSQESPASSVPTFNITAATPVTLIPNAVALRAASVEDTEDSNSSGGSLNRDSTNAGQMTAATAGLDAAFRGLLVQPLASAPTHSADGAPTERESAADESTSQITRNPLTREAGATSLKNIQPDVSGNKLPASDAAAQTQQPTNVPMTSVPANLQGQAEPAKGPETFKPKAPKTEVAAAIAVDPQVQNAVAAIVASAQTKAVEAHSSHAAIKLPAANVGAKPVNATAGHPAPNTVSSLPTASAGHETTGHERSKKEAAPTPVRASSSVSPEVPAAKTSSHGNASQADVSSLPASTEISADLHEAPANMKEAAAPTTSGPAVAARGTQDLPHVGTIVNSAALLEQMGKSEIKVGVRVGEFGNVEIRTQVEHQQVRAEISVAHHELGHALAAEMPALQQKLRDQDVPLLALNLTGQGAGNSSDPQSDARQNVVPTSQMSSAMAGDSLPGAQINDQVDTHGGLDIRI